MKTNAITDRTLVKMEISFMRKYYTLAPKLLQEEPYFSDTDNEAAMFTLDVIMTLTIMASIIQLLGLFTY